jgi:shikimate dehydrogenase
VLGSPIGHSLSPVMHRAAYARLGLDWRYDAYDVDEAALPGFVADLDAAWRGLSLTMPLKRAVLPLLDERSDTVRETGAANTVLLDDGGLSGHNTDVPGIVAALAERGVVRVDTVAVAGAGATAESFAVASRRIGAESVRFLVRDPGRAEELAERVRAGGVDVAVGRLDEAGPIDAELLVSTVPAPAAAPLADRLGSGCRTVFDAIYDPWPTPLARGGLASGRTVVSGIDLLAHQAAIQVRLMTGRDVPVDVVREPALAALA